MDKVSESEQIKEDSIKKINDQKEIFEGVKEESSKVYCHKT